MRETSTKVRGFALEIEGNGRQFSGAVFSPDEKYRYVLWREWSEASSPPGRDRPQPVDGRRDEE
jgi:hypothetical protein